MAVLSMLLLDGCHGGKAASNTPKIREKAVSGRTFVIALLPKENIFAQKRRYEPLAEYLSKSLGMNIKTRVLDSYDSVYKEMLTNKVDGAFFGGLGYVVMRSKIKLEPVARSVLTDGRSDYRGVIFALRNRGITADISSWRGKRIGLVSRSTASGYLFPRWYLYKRGVRNFAGYFGRVYYMGSHDATIRAVTDNKIDIGCSTDRIFDKFLTKSPQETKDLVILATSGPFPSDTLAIRKGSLDSGREKLLKEALLDMDKTEEGRNVLLLMGAVRYVETRASDYEGIRSMIKDLSLRPDFFTQAEIGRHISGKPAVRP